MTNIAAVVFDFGGVLDVPEDRESWLAQRDHLAAGVGMTGEGFWHYLFRSDAWERAKRGQITEEAFWADRLMPLGMHSEAQRRAFVARLMAGRGVHPAMRALLERLQARYTLALLSNTAVRNMADWLAESFDLTVFDEVISSADVGLAKPEEAIYRLLLERLRLPPETVLFIDDLARNTTAADALGIQTIIFESPEVLVSVLQAHGMLDDGRL